MKWVTKDYKGNEQIWYSGIVIDRIKQIVQEAIKKRPHSDNSILEKVLKIIQETDGEY